MANIDVTEWNAASWTFSTCKSGLRDIRYMHNILAC